MHICYFMKIQEEYPATITKSIKLLSLKEVLKEWGNKFQKYLRSAMKKINFRNMFKPMHWKELDDTKGKSVL